MNFFPFLLLAIIYCKMHHVDFKKKLSKKVFRKTNESVNNLEGAYWYLLCCAHLKDSGLVLNLETKFVAVISVLRSIFMRFLLGRFFVWPFDFLSSKMG